MEKPPEERPTASSGLEEAVPPTAVTYGDAAGQFGWNLWSDPQLAPLSPDAKSSEMPRAPALTNSALMRSA